MIKLNEIRLKTPFSHSFTHIINNVRYKFVIQYNSVNDRYYLSLYEHRDDRYEEILCNVKLTVGIDLFSIVNSYKDIGGCWIIPLYDSYIDKNPQIDNIQNFTMILRHM